MVNPCRSPLRIRLDATAQTVRSFRQLTLIDLERDFNQTLLLEQSFALHFKIVEDGLLADFRLAEQRDELSLQQRGTSLWPNDRETPDMNGSSLTRD
jgi:hypothetical protein